MHISLEEYERIVPTLTGRDLCIFLQRYNLMPVEKRCESCGTSMNINSYKKNREGVAWRCINRNCKKFKIYISIRTGTFFQHFHTEIAMVLRIIGKWVLNNTRASITESTNVSDKTVKSIIDELVKRIPNIDFSRDKLGGLDRIVQIDETMLNYKVKSHRGRAPSNRSDALVIVEYVNSVTRVFACVIQDKKASTVLPVILRQVVPGSLVYTDESKIYKDLLKEGFRHGTVCHKYNFVDPNTGVNTQAVESINNLIKREIKYKMGVITEKRDLFLKEWCFRFNNKNNLLMAILEVLLFN